MADDNNPVLFGTQKDYAWDAWQKAFDAGPGTSLPDPEKFNAWWNNVGTKVMFATTRDMMFSAWAAGITDRIQACNAGFPAWWQQILDSQPKTT